MHTSKTTGAVVCAIALGWVTSAVAVQPLEMINAIVLESSTPNQLVVTGHNFNNGGTVQLTLGGTPLIVQSQTDTVLVADLPDSILPGSYVLVAWSGNGAVREDSMDITIGAEGPAGPQGDVGPAGKVGAPGADGSSCSATDTIDGALISCTDGTSAIVFDGTDGVDGLPGVKGDTGDRGPPGLPGSDGLPGLPGIDGQDGSSCSVVDGDGFATISCDDGTTATVNDGARGDEGPPGPPGSDAPDLTADICALYEVVLSLGGPPLPTYCSPPPADPDAKIIFVTGVEYFVEEIGGLAGADQLCNQDAELAGLEGTFQAWLSDSSIGGNPDSRSTKSAGQYANTRGEIVAENWEDLTDGTLDAAIYTQYGEQGSFAWTNTLPNGGGGFDTPIATCNDWTSYSVIPAAIGNPMDLEGGRWTWWDTFVDCSGEYGLICIEQ